MRLHSLELTGFKSFSKKTNLEFEHPVVSIVGPNGSGKSNVVEAFRFVLGEQSMKSMRGKAGADLIFKGSKMLPKGSKAVATIYFNNQDKVFKLVNEEGVEMNLNYDVISISREVYPDGLNKYILNGSEVRLKDINNLLASVNIGASGHHIISQGEADRVLNSNPKDLREIMEDALGLKVYQYKIKETTRKLERADLNMKEVSMLRRENAPHLNFLRRQVEKLEKAKEMQAELALLYRKYLKKENAYLESEKSGLASEKETLKRELEAISKKISETSGDSQGSKKIENLRALEQKINQIRSVKGELERSLGRIEGMIEMEERRQEEKSEIIEISQSEIQTIVTDINASIDEAIKQENIIEIRPILEKIKGILGRFSQKKESRTSDIENLKKNQQDIAEKMKVIESSERGVAEEIERVKKDIEHEAEVLRDMERERFNHKVKHQELTSALEVVHIKEENLRSRTEAFETEIKEGVALIGAEILQYKNFEVEESVEPTEEQKRKIDRIKIKLEDAGLGNSTELLKEYNEVSERDQFLAKELEDLAKSIETLTQLMVELKNKIDTEFNEGVKKINKEFKEFFQIMFGGGDASLSIVIEEKRKKKDLDQDEGEQIIEEEEKAPEQGLEINISLPHKKVKELQALSGGERSLTSIALLFAMSQVNPPPFLILDETDAALDESNSRKFGDMIERLSKHSQLIVVTHNRESMSRAGILYGVTIGSDGGSKLLSVKFEEAVAIAK